MNQQTPCGPQENIKTSSQRIKKYIRQTPLEYSFYLSQQNHGSVYLKLENQQLTGSFKIRGALNKYLSLSGKGKKQGIVAASTGNHGTAVAYVCQKFNSPGMIFVPENTLKTKLESIKSFGMAIQFHGIDCLQTEIYARQYAQDHGMIYMSPYNDYDIVWGQGTIAPELINQLKETGMKYQSYTILIPVGGGGLISGIAVYLKSLNSSIKIIGCQPENSPVMYRSILAGRILDMPSLPTLSQATAGGIETGSITFKICQQYVDDFILVSEAEIEAAIKTMIMSHSMLVEGAAALPVAALLKDKNRFQNQCIILILSGSRLGLTDLYRMIKGND